MIFFPNFLQVCNICAVLHCVTAYVLFAANLDDFKSIAKKFIPAKLADQLADMASPSSNKYLQKAVEKEEEYSDNEDSIESDEKGGILVDSNKEQSRTPLKKRFSVENQLRDINIDEIVEKVRIKLEKKYNNVQNTHKIKVTDKKYIDNLSPPKYKQKPIKNVKEEVIYDNDSKSDEEVVPEDITERQNEILNEAQYEEERSANEEAVTSQTKSTDIENIFHEIDMRKSNDSYEDYVTPKRDQSYEKEETEHSRVSTTKKNSFSPLNEPQKKQKPIRFIDKRKPNEKVTTASYDYSEEIKAKTESLVYDEKETVYVTQSRDGVKLNPVDPIAVNRQIDGPVHNIKKSKGTMIPTRELYKMSSPNYYAKLPIIADTYNFDEPIPDRDREPENLKYFGNPLASINHKVKL